MPAENKKLVIVESPAKARTISRILGKDYNVVASMGHVRDLPEKSFGVDIKNGFQPIYRETRPKQVSELRKAAKGVSEIYLAPDPDREGEAIAWHIKEILDGEKKRDFHRVVFHEITRSAVKKSFENPGELNMDLVDAQQARRVLDRLVGYKISPLLWTRIKRGVSAGRVQSVALRLVCEREREIMAFKPVEYWILTGSFEQADGDGCFEAVLYQINGEKAGISSESQAREVVSALGEKAEFNIAEVKKTEKKRNAPPPFITSTLQQAAGAALRFGAGRTMRIAQQLYEGIEIGNGGPTGLITYMRTDSFSVAREALDSCREYIASNVGREYLPEKPNFFKSRASAQAAHEAIRPTDVNLTPERAKNYLDNSQLRLYTIIWRRFVASQMSPARYANTSVLLDSPGSDGRDYVFRASATICIFPGYMKVYKDKDGNGEDDVHLPVLEEGASCILAGMETEQKFTEAPPRFTEATLIRELERNGIGRPSTYASIVNTIQKRDYTGKDKGRLVPTELGLNVNDYLVQTFPELVQVGFTAEMESRLDKIEEGGLKWTEMLSDFYEHFSAWLDDLKQQGAPEPEKAAGLFGILDKVDEWQTGTGSGGRKFDDRSFVESLEKQFKEKGSLTGRQWDALLKVASKYAEKIPGFGDFAAESGIAAEIKEKQLAVSGGNRPGEAPEDDKRIMELFDSVELDTGDGGRYDDGKFVASINSQVESGRALTPRQKNALGKLALKYRNKLEDFSRLSELLGIEEEAEKPPDTESAQMLKELEAVDKWDEPVKRKKRTYDDKAFVESLAKQFERRGSLSPKQKSALRKIHARYSGKRADKADSGK